MLTFLLSRGVPTQKYSTYGVFEFDQARALTQAGCKVVFLALDLRSVRRVRKWGFSSFERDGVQVRVLSIPLGNIPKKIFYPIGEWGLKMLYRRAVRDLCIPCSGAEKTGTRSACCNRAFFACQSGYSAV